MLQLPNRNVIMPQATSHVPGSLTAAAERERLESRWRLRLEDASSRYKIANTCYRKTLAEQTEGVAADVGLAAAMMRAREEESHALAEYTRVLGVFTDLTTMGITGEQLYQTTSDQIRAAGLVAIVDDDESVRESTGRLLRSVGYRIRTFASAQQFVDAGIDAEAGCLILDVRMPEIDGLELQRRLNVAHAPIPIIFITAHDDGSARQRAIKAGAVDVLHKPFAADVLLAIVASAIKRWVSTVQEANV